jgi:purine-binding chemotaxis protein CheW
MDLAKIRQKSRQDLEIRNQDELFPVPDAIPVSVSAEDSVTSQQIPEEQDFFDEVEQLPRNSPFPAHHQGQPQLRRAQKDPLAAILAGRAMAGCDEFLENTPEEQAITVPEGCQKYLCFRVSDEVYGINIMEIKELIKPREVTEVPRAPAFVSGVISLRGVIIPIIDMLQRLGLAREAVTGRERVIVVRHAESFSGLLVDEVIQVVRIAADCIEAAPTVLDGIDRDFVTGIGRAEGRLIIILNIGNITDLQLY